MSALDRYAVIGQPIAHSKSPFIHTAFARANEQALSYEALEVAPDALAETLKTLHGEGYLGLNVTLPHKTAVAALCEAISERAQLAGAVNTLVRTETGWRGGPARAAARRRRCGTRGDCAHSQPKASSAVGFEP